MDIYIRTQNKEQLIKIQKDITITDAKKYKKMFNIIDADVMSSEYDKVDGIDIIREIASVEGYLLTTDKLLLGTYKTKKRDELLLTFERLSNIELLDKLMELNVCKIPENLEIARIGLHKMRLYVLSIPKDLVEKSKKWLLDNGFSLEVY